MRARSARRSVSQRDRSRDGERPRRLPSRVGPALPQQRAVRDRGEDAVIRAAARSYSPAPLLAARFTRVMTMAMRSVGALVIGFLLLGCEDAPKQKNPFDPPANKPIEPPPAKEPPKPEGPPSLEIDSISPKVGFERALFQHPDGKQKLAAALAQHKAQFEGREVQLIVDRKAKQDWVSAYLTELGNIGVPRVKVKTETRPEFPS